MAFIDSTLNRSPLSASMSGKDDLDEDDKITEPDEDEGLEPTKHKSLEDMTLLENLVSQIDDINIARSLPHDLLNEIGATVVREYEIDETSRSEWKDKAERAMKFALQESQPKSYPFPGASSIVFPLISSAALEFGARTYPAIVQGRNVVKGIVWGSDQGLPLMEPAPQQPGAQQPAPPPAPPRSRRNKGAPPPPKGPMVPAMDQNGQPLWLMKPGEKRERADRIGEFMSWQLLDEMPEWEPQTDQLLHQIPVVGGAARKTYRDEVEHRNRSLFVSLMNLVWNYHAPSFELAPRVTEKLLLYPNEIVEYERAGASDDEDGMFLHLDYGPAGGADDMGMGFADNESSGDNSDPDAPHLFIEQHRLWDLDGDGYAEPYIVTVHRRSSQVVRITARYDEDGIEASKDGETIYKIMPDDQYTLIPFLPNLDGGSYPMGFGHLLHPLNEAINTTFNQMFDAGHLQNAGGGFFGDSLGVSSGAINFSVGKYVRVTTKGQAIRDAVFPLPFPGPSPVLFQLLGVLMTAGQKLAGIQDVLTGDAAMANAPPTTVLALIEQGLKLYTAIHKRVYRALKAEFLKLYKLNKKHLDKPQRYRIGDEWREVSPEDFRLGGGVEPVADPTMVTDMQKLVRGQILMNLVENPLMDPKAIIQRFLDGANIERTEELFQPPNPQAAQMAQLAMQMDMAMKQAELGRVRAAEQKDATQAFLNLAMARAKASGPEETAIQAQMDFLRLHIEALNTTVKAAMVDAQMHKAHRDDLTTRHGIATRSYDAHLDRMAGDGALDMGATASAARQAAAVQPTPGPTGAFPVAPNPPAAAMGGALAGAGGPASIGSPMASPDSVLGAPSIPGRAGGGPINAGQPYIVGEKGPEVVVPNQDGTVIPNGGGAQADPADMTNLYNTQLSPGDEAKFQTWAKANPRLGSSYDYDARGFWKAGAATGDFGHGDDEFKKPNHPTWSTNSNIRPSGMTPGRWAQGTDGSYTFYASPDNLRYQDPGDLQAYWNREEKPHGNTLVMPPKSNK